MGRPVRIEYAGANYHVLARARRGRQICQDDTDRTVWLGVLEEACNRTGWRVHAWVLLDDHYQLLLETPEANLVSGMKWFQGTYTQRYNSRHPRPGSLFQGRYHAAPVDVASPECVQAVSNRIHLEPARDKAVQPGLQKLRDYRWSSYPGYLQAGKPNWLYTELVLGSFGLRTNECSRFEEFLEQRVLDLSVKANVRRMNATWRGLHKTWYIGGEDFRQKLLSNAKAANSETAGERIGAHNQAEAQRMLEQGLRVLGLREEDLAAAPKGQLQKQVLAWWLFRSTTVTRRWIADRLSMGCESRVSQAVSLIGSDFAAEVSSIKQMLSGCADS